MKSAFVLMPFAKRYDSYYLQVFKPALEQCGYIVKRADDMFGPRPVMNDIRAMILEADVLLCEMTGKNANVFYELGLAHAIGKQVILVSQVEKDIPFDLRHIRVLLYNTSEPDWSRHLLRRIKQGIHDLESAGNSWPPPLIPTSITDPFQPHKDLSILRTREATVQVLSSIVGMASADDLIFGSCNLCSDYPKEFYDALPQALERGVKIHFIVKNNIDSQQFIEYMRQLRKAWPAKMILAQSQDEYLRMFGLEGKQVLLAIPFDNVFLGLYARDRRVANYLKLSFDRIAAAADEISY